MGQPLNPLVDCDYLISCSLIFRLVVSTPLKNISQLGWLFPIYGKIQNVPKPTNQFSLSMLTNPFESQLMRIISSTFSSLNLSSTGLMASANLAAVRWPRWHQLGKTKQHGFPLPTCIDGVWWDITEQIVGDLDILNEKDLGFRWGMMGWNHHNGHHWMVLYPICGIGIWSASGPRTFWSSLRCHQT